MAENRSNAPVDDDEDYLVVDFRGLEAAQGRGFRAARVPKGQYLLEITAAFTGKNNERTKPKKERSRQVTVHFRIADGEYIDLEIQDQFNPVPVVNDTETKFPTQRLIRLLECIDQDVAGKKVGMHLNDWAGRMVLAQLDDNEIPASEQNGRKFNARVVSAPVAYDPVPEEWFEGGAVEEAPAPAKASRNGASKAQEPAPEEEEDVEEEDEPEDDESEEETDDDADESEEPEPEPEPVQRRSAPARSTTNGRTAAPARTATAVRPAARNDDDPFGARSPRRG